MSLIKTNPFSRFMLRQKFAVLAVFALILVGTAFYSVVADQWRQIRVTQHEREGLELARALLTLSQQVSEHRSLAVGFVTGEQASAHKLALKNSINQGMADFAAAAPKDSLQLQKLWEVIAQEWPKISRKAADHAVTPPELFQLEAWLIGKLHETLSLVIDQYGLSLDPNPESYFLIRALLVDAPKVAEALDMAKSWGTGLLLQTAEQARKKPDVESATNNIGFQDRGRLIFMVSLANEHLDNAEADFNNFLQAERKLIDPERQTALQRQFNQTGAMLKQAIAQADAEIISQAQSHYPAQDYFAKHDRAVAGLYQLINTATVELDAIFARQIKAAGFKLAGLSTAIIILIAVCALVAFLIADSITRPVRFLVEVMRKLAAGDNTQRAQLPNTDEIGLLAQQFDRMVDQREAVRAKIERENEALNNSVIALLLSVAQLAKKDLTVRAVVAEDVTGPVADALNLLAEETAKVLQTVTQASAQVAEVAQKVQEQSLHVLHVAADEKQEVAQTAEELQAASTAMQAIAQLTVACNHAADTAISNTDAAQAIVLDTMQGITAIRDTIRETEKRIKRLGERSQEIGGVVNIINEIAERTHILALNAAMHAAAAGEAGRGFAVVAGEVQKLAENARSATAKISALVSNIQIETRDTVITMNNAISQVVEGTELARQAGDKMRGTRETTADLVQLVQRIAISAGQQSENTQGLLERARQIQKSTDETYVELQDQGGKTERLVALSAELLTSVGVFVLPEAC